jgi:hypothetical protein
MIGIAFEFVLALGLVLVLASSARVGRRGVAPRPRNATPTGATEVR